MIIFCFRMVTKEELSMLYLGFSAFQDFVPTSKDYHSASRETKFENDPRLMSGLPENGGLSPRFSSSRIHNPGSAAAGSPIPVDNFERQFLRVLHKVYQTIEKNEMRLAEQDRRDQIRLEWQQIALIVDRILLICFIALTLGVTLGILFSAPHSTAFIFGDDD